VVGDVDGSDAVSAAVSNRLVDGTGHLFGPLLGRFGRAEVPLPGGCVLGTRATDMHEQAFRALGATVSNAHGYLIAVAKRGTRIVADFGSLGRVEVAFPADE